MATRTPTFRSTILGRAQAYAAGDPNAFTSDRQTTSTTPTMSLQDAVAEYQRANAPSVAAFSGLIPYLTEKGYQVSYATHGAGGSLRSNDAFVDSAGRVYDVLVNSDSATPSWNFGDKGTYDAGRPVMTADGQSLSYEEWATSLGATTAPANPNPTGTRGASPPHNGNPNNAPVVGQAMIRGSGPSNSIVAARSAQSRIRQQARNQGRSSTILGGFNTGVPLVRPATLLGGGY